MGLNLSNKVSSDDISAANNAQNPPEFSAGFEPASTDIMSLSDDMILGDLDSGEDDIDSVFGGGGSSTNSDGSVFGTDTTNTNSGFGDNNNGIKFDTTSLDNQNNQTKSRSDEIADAALDIAYDFGGNIIKSYKFTFKSVGMKTGSDFGYLGSRLIIIGLIGLVLGIVLIIACNIAGVGLAIIKMLATVTFASGLVSAFGLISMGAAAYSICVNPGSLGDNKDSVNSEIDNIMDVGSFDGEQNKADDYSSIVDSIADEIFGSSDELEDDDEDEDDLSDLLGISIDDIDKLGNDNEDNDEDDIDLSGIGDTTVNFDDALNDVTENGVITREVLVDTFYKILPKCNEDFSEMKEIPEGSTEFIELSAVCLKALANLCNCSRDDLHVKLETAKKSIFAYELRMQRYTKVKRTEEYAKELDYFFKDSSTDDTKVTTVDIEGDYFKITVTTGDNCLVSLGDVLSIKKCRKFFENAKHVFPMSIGVDIMGNPELVDAKSYDSMLIAGKPNSGKSWYCLIILMSLMLFNLPEDVQLIIVDPKRTSLFKTMALMPHVCGLFDDSNILEVLSDVIDVEAERRTKILEDNDCDDIWALREKGIKLPILYIFIDEYISVLNGLGKMGSELNSKLQILISQYRSKGIRMIFVPHRSTGVVDKTNRTMLQFTSSIRADNADVKDTLNIDKWDRALVFPGDTAVKAAGMREAKYLKGLALCKNDDDNKKFIRAAAKAFYKMGVELPDMRAMTIACNRDDNYIRKALYSENTVQYSSANVLKDLD